MVPDNVISPLPVPVVTTTSLPESVVSRLPDEPRTKLPLPSSPAETVIRSEATTAAFTVMSSSALSVTIVGSIDAAIVISSAASRRIVPLPFSLALTSMLPTVVPAVIFVSPTTVTLAASVTSEALTRSRPAPALLAPLISIELSSVRSTEPDELKIKVPKFTVLPASLPRVIALPVKLALPATTMSPSIPSEILPVVVTVSSSTSTSNSKTSSWAARTKSCASTVT